MFLALPEIELTKVDVTETEMQVQWKFDSDSRTKRAVGNKEYSVEVLIKYKKESDKEYSTYPEDGNKLLADKVMMYKTMSSKHLLKFENMVEIRGLTCGNTFASHCYGLGFTPGLHVGCLSPFTANV